ncbi:L-histidine N(alpha)-methyltransferase [Pseudoalteromonas sp. SR44-8]|uniref:L-histidine N(alpha)-methyltransferase n=1 Tax=Pseudoalteromonas sp. SR44-8 TaxID=2760933 RepID=UPI001601716A|nr:L-histidine N(alpha)-methyltransferase [Pseudoalteromonas sp. SR44-8]MBB1299961.1 L-histidine N(alpha)-methyltransferase [Pseudoalteromonas sp. SR44-8]
MSVKDWKSKKEIVRLLYNEMSDEQVIVRIYYDQGNFNFTLEGLIDFYKYRWGKPGRPLLKRNNKYIHFFKVLSIELGLDEEVFGNQIVYGDLIDFMRALPVEGLERVRSAINNHEIEDKLIEKCIESELNLITKQFDEPSQNLNLNIEVPKSASWFAIYHKSGEKKKTIEQAFFNNSLDQSAFYQTPESVLRWQQIIEHPLYEGFDACKGTLKKFVKTSHWKSLINSKDFDGCIVLTGGGAPEKDLIITSSIINEITPKKPILHALIDTSSYMLSYSINFIEERINTNLNVLSSYIDFKFLECDIFQLSDLWLKKKGKNYCWFIPGGTLGNLSEKAVFELLASQCNEGDMLVLGIGIVPTSGRAEDIGRLKDQLIEEYKSDEVMDLLKIPIQSLCGVFNQKNNLVENVMKTWKLDVLEDNESSDVKGSLTPVASVELESKERVELFKSTRYDLDELILFAKKYRFEYINNISHGDESYCQVVFKREATR